MDNRGSVGTYNSITTDSSGNVHISYHSSSNFNLKYANNTSGQWQTEVVKESSGETYVGIGTSIAVDLSNNVHISYCNYIKGLGIDESFYYATNSSGSWKSEYIKGIVSTYIAGNTSLGIDSDGIVQIAFFDGLEKKFYYANNAKPLNNDCAGIDKGFAYYDNCGNCVGGTTGLQACTQDCTGIYGGSAYYDRCGNCVGGNTGLTPCSSSTGYMAASDLWIRAVIQTVDGPIEGVWQEGGKDTTSAGHKVVWGYFYASPSDVSWGSKENPDIFVKIWFDTNGRIDVNYFHVSVPDINVYAEYKDSSLEGLTTLDRRYIRLYYNQSGKNGVEENDEDGIPAAGYSPSKSPQAYSTVNKLGIGAVINTVDGPIDAVWKKGGDAMTAGGHQVLWGHFYADPSDVNWGSENNPDLFVKVWFDASGRIDVNFFHVSVPDIEVYSDYPEDGYYDEKGTTIIVDRYIRHEYRK